jgi:hypothetical protein
LAKCQLEIDHPNFRFANAQPVVAGLKKLCHLVARDHKLSGWVPHPMPGWKQFQNRIWKWDFRPDGERSSTRKGWRVYAWVPDASAPEPIPAFAFLCYDKDETPRGDHTKFLAGELKKFLADLRSPEIDEPRFRHQVNGAGDTVSICTDCYGLVIISQDEIAIAEAENSHQCTEQRVLFP